MVGQKSVHFQGKDVALVLKLHHSRVIKDMTKGNKFILKEKTISMWAQWQQDSKEMIWSWIDKFIKLYFEVLILYIHVIIFLPQNEHVYLLNWTGGKFSIPCPSCLFGMTYKNQLAEKNKIDTNFIYLARNN